MAEGGAGNPAISQEEKVDNEEQQINEFSMLESIFERQMIVLNQGTEFLVCLCRLAIMHLSMSNPAPTPQKGRGGAFDN